MNPRLIVRPLFAALLFSGFVHATPMMNNNIRITEWMYTPTNTTGEFIEFTNMGNSAIDFAGWSFDDVSRNAGSQSLSAFGIVQAGESVILAEASAVAFRAAWNLADAVKVIGGNTNNLARADEINLYDNTNTLIDRLTFDDQTIGGPRTRGISGNPGSLAVIGANNASLWTLSYLGDAEGSWSANGDIGNPGTTVYAAPIPEADIYALTLAGMGLVGLLARRRKSN